MSSLDRTPPIDFLAKLAPQSATAWLALGAKTFPGELSIATDNSVYRFKNGIFLSRAKKPSRSFDCPRQMRGLRLVGFFHDEGGLWSFSSRWREGAHAVMWKPSATEDEAPTFLLTSATSSFTLEEPEPKPAQPEPTPTPWIGARKTSDSGVMIRRIARPPSFRDPLPPSMTRIHTAVQS